MNTYFFIAQGSTKGTKLGVDDALLSAFCAAFFYVHSSFLCPALSLFRR